ncbi:MAG: accessory factor UbiK family protein [Moraxellaceae bacterium]|jgi:BMFP domain-containing protein YqiC|nr:accessory factor UbiK family protein [Moraxellaceae bacterium]MBP7230010.1 accessory factor UbiK family protein [Moraxellaceae bacterium]MBP8852360.1 accessory factor UbiK family protein [Moraxellaceae bacterium]MBP9045519.1 accessory factor UbiK family protein [Moraxellaceae bacterium]MBP9731257.1 accessory factor UbiK family protein [Moraxellaceae bacterium]
MALEQIVNRVSEQLSQILPPGVRQLRGDIEENIKVVLREALARMELVTREEFDVQSALLSRTRSRLEAVEKELKALEQRVVALEGRGSDQS